MTSPTDLQIFKTLVRSFKETIDGESDAAGHVGIHLAEHYNGLLIKAAQHDSIKEHLPKKIGKSVTFGSLGKTEVTFVELKVYLNELLSLVSLIEEAE